MKPTALLLATLCSVAMAAILPYPAPKNLVDIARLGPSEDYTVTLRGATGPEVPVFVYASSNYWEHKARRMQDSVSFTSFAFTNETVTVTVHCRFPVDSAVLRPLGAGVKLEQKGQVLTFTLNRPRQIALEVNDPKHPLLIFAEGPENLDTGATHYWAPGTVTKIGDRFEVKEGESVYIAGGAVVEGTFALVGNNHRFGGRGIFSSGHVPWPKWDADKTLCQFGGQKFRTIQRETFEDLILLNSPGWTIYGDIEKSTVRNVKSIAWNGNSDGIHLGGESTMEGSFFFVNDDCLIANRGNNNTWRGCTIWRSPWGHPIISLLTKRQSRNYLWEDIDIISTEGTGPLITLKNYKNWGAGGVFEDFTVRQVRVEGPRVGPLIKIESTQCQVRNFRVEDLSAESILESEGLLALPEEPSSPSVSFKNVVLGGKLLSSSDEGGMKTSGDQSGVTFSK